MVDKKMPQENQELHQQELVMKLQQGYGQSREIEEQLNIIEEQLVQLEEFKRNLNDLDKTKENEILASLGKGVFIKSDIKDKKLYVDVGSNVFVRKSPIMAIETVDEQLKRLGEMKIQLSTQIESIHLDLQGIIGDIER